MATNKLKICVCTSYAADREPRAPRHARAIWESGMCSQLTFIDVRPAGQPRESVESLRGIPRLKWLTIEIPLRQTQPATWAAGKITRLTARLMFRATGFLSNAILSPWLSTLQTLIRREQPDVILAHNIDTLLPAFLAAKSLGAKLAFDSMEYHSDMGDEQDMVMIKAIQSVESRCLPECDFVLASSRQVADALKTEYGLRKVIPLNNVPATICDLAESKTPWMSLYWRNSTIGLGQRGLEEAVRALALLPEPIVLHLQGRTRPELMEEVMQLATSVGVSHRIEVHPPYRAENAVREASRFHVGLCLERPGIRNHELTVSNKMFDYHMAGMAVISSDMPSLAGILEKSHGGLTFRAGDHKDLANTVLRFFEDKPLYDHMAANARAFALREGNLECEMSKLKSMLQDRFAGRSDRP